MGADDPPRPEPHRVAVAIDSVEPPGTELGPGVEVQAGSSLVGAPFPLLNMYAQNQGEPVRLGWQALLVVDGDPVDVWDRYASELGVGDHASARNSCAVAPQRWAEHTMRDAPLKRR